MFGGIRSDGKCLINFTDISYTNDGIVKIDNNYVNTYEYQEGMMTLVGVSSLNNYDANVQHFLNLSAINKIDDFVFMNQNKMQSISFIPNEYGIGLQDIGNYAFYGCGSLMSINSNKLSSKNVGCYAFADCMTLLNI